MTDNKASVVMTKRKIGKVTYTICSSASQPAAETLDKKIKNWIKRDVEERVRNSEKT